MVEYELQAIPDMPAVVRFNGTWLETQPVLLLVAVQWYVSQLDARFNLALSVAVGFVIRIDGHWLGPAAELQLSRTRSLGTLCAPAAFFPGCVLRPDGR